MMRTYLFENLGRIGALAPFTDRFSLFGDISRLGALTAMAEDWREATVEITGILQINVAQTLEVDGFALTFGLPGAQHLSVPIRLALPRTPMEAVFASLALLSEVMTPEDVAKKFGERLLDPKRTIADSIRALGSAACQIGPIPASLSLPGDWLVPGRHILDAEGRAIGVEAVPDAPPPHIPIGDVTLTVSSSGMSFQLAHARALSLAPVMIAGSGVALELSGLTLHMGDGPLPPGVAALGAERGFDDNWCGVFFDSVTLWHLDRLLPFAPQGRAADGAGQISASAFAIDKRGMTGALSIHAPRSGHPRVVVEEVTLAFDRSWVPEAISGRGSIAFDDLGANSMAAEAHVAFDPFKPLAERWRADIRLSGGRADGTLFKIDDPPPAFSAALGAVAAGLGDSESAFILAALAAFESVDLMAWDAAAITSAAISARPGPEGLEFSGLLHLQAEVSLNVPGGDPVPVSFEAGAVALSYSPRHGLKSAWTMADGLSLCLPVEVDIAGFLTLESVRLRQREDGALLVEFALESDGAGTLAISGAPNVLTLVYQPGPPSRATIELSRDGQPVTLLVPGVLYAEGSLRKSNRVFPVDDGHSWGAALEASLSAYIIGDGQAKNPADHLDKKHYLFALDFGLLTATRDDGLKAMVLTGDLAFRPGLPLGASGTALYGLGLTYGQNTEPDTAGSDYAGWFLEKSPKFSTHAQKWRPAADAWGFGASVSLGSQPDEGRAWNVTAGLFLLLPGPVVMVTGKGALFSPPTALPANGQSASVDAPFGATIVLDLLRQKFSADLVADLDIKAGDRRLLKLDIPATIEASLAPPMDMALNIGRFSPKNQRVRGRALDLFDISAYIMVQSGTIRDFPGAGSDLPGFAMAYGGAGSLSAGFSSSIAELRLRAEAGFDLGVSLANPPLLVGQVYVNGELYARLACFSLSLAAKLALAAVVPSPFRLAGKARFKVGMPWPIPDIKFSGTFTIGGAADWPDSYAHSAHPLSAVSLFSRPHGASSLETGEAFDAVELKAGKTVPGVPVDAGILISFRAPMGNEAPTIGLIKTQGDDKDYPVWEIASTGETADGETVRYGWRHVLKNIELREQGGAKLAAHASWTKGCEGGTLNGGGTASGGQPARTTLTLLAPADDPVSRRVGTGAEMLQRALDGWMPCAVPLSDKERMAAFLPPAREEVLPETLSGPSRQIHWFPADRAFKLRRYSAVREGGEGRLCYMPPTSSAFMVVGPYRIVRPLYSPASIGQRLVVPNPLGSQSPLLTLPTVVFPAGRRLGEIHQTLAALQMLPGRLRAYIPAGSGREVYVMFRASAYVDMRADGAARLHMTVFDNVELPNVREPNHDWRLGKAYVPDHVEHIDLSALSAEDMTPGIYGTTAAFFIGLSLYEPEGEEYAARERLKEASVDLVTHVADLAAAWSKGDAEGLLKPDTDYAVHLQIETRRARQIGHRPLELDPGAPKVFDEVVSFRTERDLRQPLTPRRQAPAWAAAKSLAWSVDVAPGNMEYHYRSDKLVITFADAAVMGRIAAHGRLPKLHLSHQSGRSLDARAAKILARAKRDLAREQEVFAQYVEAQSCLAPGAPMWLENQLVFDTLLEEGLYVATLLGAAAAPARPDQDLHVWRFHASRWESFAAHLAAHVGHMEKTLPSRPQIMPDVMRALVEAKAGDAALIVDDGLLDRLVEILGMAPRTSPDSPELALIETKGGLTGLLFDGPEPLLKAESAVTMAAVGGAVKPVATVVNSFGSRVLVVLEAVGAPSALKLVLARDHSTTASIQIDLRNGKISSGVPAGDLGPTEDKPGPVEEGGGGRINKPKLPDLRDKPTIPKVPVTPIPRPEDILGTPKVPVLKVPVPKVPVAEVPIVKVPVAPALKDKLVTPVVPLLVPLMPIAAPLPKVGLITPKPSKKTVVRKTTIKPPTRPKPGTSK